jgi:hypothetical protein
LSPSFLSLSFSFRITSSFFLSYPSSASTLPCSFFVLYSKTAMYWRWEEPTAESKQTVSEKVWTRDRGWVLVVRRLSLSAGVEN